MEDAMDNVVTFPTTQQDNYEGANIAVRVLKMARERHGLDQAMHLAEEMILSCSAIYARERGPDAALEVLEGTAMVLPGRGRR
jgi:hypothetical protein